ncbi:LPS export ABC transporter periplasmic protein LptC [candidate division KSB1 bacterium]|nr:LPS export ABC transporter periplasmic protein LptC [candidate division KSB1 bacterium]
MSILQKTFISISIIMLFAWGCQNNVENKITQTPENELPDQETWNSTLIATSEGTTSAIIEFGHMERYNEQQLILFDQNIEVDFFDDQGNHTSKLTSNKGRMDEKSNIITAYENVVVVSDSGINLYTEKLWWDNNREKVITDQFVTITTNENDTLHGVGFESDQTLSNWMIKDLRGKTSKTIDLNLENRPSPESDTTQTDTTTIE